MRKMVKLVSEICKTAPNYAKVANESDNIANAAKSEFVVAGMSQKSVEEGKIAKVFVMSSCMFNKGLLSCDVYRMDIIILGVEIKMLGTMKVYLVVFV